MLSRRGLLKSGIGSAGALAALSVAPAAFSAFQLAPLTTHVSAGDSVRTLSFCQTHNSEKLTATFFECGQFNEDGVRKIEHILRDFRTGEVHKIDRDLLMLLSDLKISLGTDQPFHIISGFRSAETNAMLASTSTGVAKKSLHMLGQAIDIRIPGVRTLGLRNQAKNMQRGGVGYYEASDFVHVDVGPVRWW